MALKNFLAKLTKRKQPSIKHPYALYDKIGKETFPRQSRIGQRVEVTFKNGSGMMFGQVVRGDNENPHETIVQLDDGRVVRHPEVFISYNAPAKPKPLPPETMASREETSTDSDNIGDIEIKKGDGDV